MAATPFHIGLLGYLGSATVSRDSVSKAEGPLAFAVQFDIDVKAKWTFGAEHLRSLSLSPMGTSVSTTSFVGKWFFVSAVPQTNDPELPRGRISIHEDGYFPYLGMAAGFAQASIDNTDPLKRIVAGGVSLGFKAGFDVPVFTKMMARAELNYGMMALGTGSITTFVLGGGLVWMF